MSPDSGIKVSGPRHFYVDRFMPGEDCEFDVVLAVCVVATDDGDDSWATKSVRFDLDGHQEKPSWRPRKFGKRFVPEPADFHRRTGARVTTIQMAIDLADVDSFDGNANRRWMTDSNALYDDRRFPVMWIRTTTGLKYDCFSALRADHEDYTSVMDVNYTCMRGATDIHLDASCRGLDYEHYSLYPELMKAENHALNTPVVDCGTVQGPYKTILDLCGAVPIARACCEGEHAGEDVEPALCAAPVTGCNEQQQQQPQQQQSCAVPVTGCVADSLRSVRGPGNGMRR